VGGAGEADPLELLLRDEGADALSREELAQQRPVDLAVDEVRTPNAATTRGDRGAQVELHIPNETVVLGEERLGRIGRELGEQTRAAIGHALALDEANELVGL